MTERERFLEASCRLYSSAGHAVGSGVAVGPRHVATAAHVLGELPEGDAGYVIFARSGFRMTLTLERSFDLASDSAVILLQRMFRVPAYIEPGLQAEAVVGSRGMVWASVAAVSHDIEGVPVDIAPHYAVKCEIISVATDARSFNVSIPVVRGVSGAGMVLLGGERPVCSGVVSATWAYQPHLPRLRRAVTKIGVLEHAARAIGLTPVSAQLAPVTPSAQPKATEGPGTQDWAWDPRIKWAAVGGAVALGAVLVAGGRR